MKTPKFGPVPRTLEDVAEAVKLDWPTLVTIGCSRCSRSAVRAVKVHEAVDWGSMGVPILPAGSWIFEAGRPFPTNREVGGIQVGTDDPVGFLQTVHLIGDDGAVRSLGVFSLGFKTPKGVCSRCNRWIRFTRSELDRNVGKGLWKATGD